MTATKKVLIVISNLGHGGAERQVVELANRIDKAKVDLHVCVFSEECPLKSKLNSPENLHVIKKGGRFDFFLVFKLFRFLKHHRFDVVHGFLFDAEIVSRLAGFLAQTPMVLGSERNSDSNFSKLKVAIYKVTAPLLDYCVANSNAGADFSKRTYSIPESKVVVIRNGVDVERFSPGMSAYSRSLLGLDDGKICIGMVASYKRQKNHEFLLRSLKNVGGDDYQVVFVGSSVAEGQESSGEYYRYIRGLVDELDLQDKCVFLAARDDVEQIYRLFAFTVLPSLFEGTPNVALESMACGVPVIATDVSDNRDVIPNEKVGMITALGNEEEFAIKISTMLRDRKKREQMSFAARRWTVDNFSLDQLAKNFEELYLRGR